MNVVSDLLRILKKVTGNLQFIITPSLASLDHALFIHFPQRVPHYYHSSIKDIIDECYVFPLTLHCIQAVSECTKNKKHK